MPSPHNILLQTPRADMGHTVESSLQPLKVRRFRIASSTFMVHRHVTTEPASLSEAVRVLKPRFAVLVPHFSQTLEQTASLIRACGAAKVILLDTFDQTSSPLLPLAPTVWKYVKKAVLADRTRYDTPMSGNYVFADFVERTLGFPLQGWHSGARVPASSLGHLEVGWNFAYGTSFRKLFRVSRFFNPPWSIRKYDLNTRFSVAGSTHQGSWYARYREWCHAQIDSLSLHANLTPRGRVSHARYLFELFQSRFTFSPLGYGELCLRDVECIAAGSLLIKPSVDHLITSSNLYQPGVTYVPVAWDLSDLKETIEHYLAHPAAAQRIIRNARAALRSAYKGGVRADLARVFAE